MVTGMLACVNHGRLVFAEDDMDMRDATARLLKAEGWRVRRTCVRTLVDYDRVTCKRVYDKKFHITFYRTDKVRSL